MATIIIDSALFLTEKCGLIIAETIQVLPCDYFLCLMDNIDLLAHRFCFVFFTQMSN